MRKAWIIGLVVLVAVVVGAPITASAAPEAVTPTRETPRTPQVVQGALGRAGGRVRFSLEGGQLHFGHYDTSGQLGRGTYTMTFASNDSTCAKDGEATIAHGAARFVRSDGAVLSGTAQLVQICRTVAAPEALGVKLTHGTRELASASLTLVGSLAGTYATPSDSIGVESFDLSGESSVYHRVGYWTLSTSGVVHGFGGAPAIGNAPATATSAFTHIEPTNSGNGYWLVDTDGEVFAFGDAHWYGNAPPNVLFGSVVSSLSSTPTGHGYWLFTSRGRALPFGDAKFYGDMRNVALNGPVIGSVATPTGHGYYMVALDGGVFAFGDAKFRGSMGGQHLNQPVVGLVPTGDNSGYWLVAADGGVFAFHAPFLGSMGRVPLARPVIGLARYGAGYMMVAQDGGIFDFSEEPFFGSLGGSPFTEFTIGAAAIS